LQKISLLEEQQKENDAALKALTIENEELKKHIETLQSSIEEMI
jgi:cell division protein FtsB